MDVPRDIIAWFKSLFAGKNHSLRESLEELIEEQSGPDGDLKPEEKDILQNLAGFGDLRVSDVMTPRADIVALDIRITMAELKSVIAREGHTRYPIYRSTLDDVVGFIHLKDLIPQLCGDVAYNLRGEIHHAMFVPPSMPLMDLLVRMRAAHAHLALVVDEYGGTAGLVTMEDIVEEIVGDIEDEHDELEKLLIRHPDGSVDVSARIHIEDLEQELNVKFSEEEDREYDTLAGMIFEMLGRVPATGETIPHDSGYLMEVKEGDPRRIKRVVLRRAPEPMKDTPDGATLAA